MKKFSILNMKMRRKVAFFIGLRPILLRNFSHVQGLRVSILSKLRIKLIQAVDDICLAIPGGRLRKRYRFRN